MKKTIFHALFLLSVVNLILSQTPYFPQGSPGKSHGLPVIKPDERIPGFGLSAPANNPSVLPQFQEDYLYSLNAFISDFQVNENGGSFGASQWSPSLTADNHGNFVVTWADGRNGYYDVYIQYYARDGRPVGENLKINDDTGSRYECAPSISTDGSNNYIIAWWSDWDEQDPDIYARRFTADGKSLGTEFRVNDDQQRGWQVYPSISAAIDGNFVITWEDSRDGDYNIYAARFAKDGHPLGTNFRVNDDAGSEYQGNPAVATDSGGNFVITWTDSRHGNNDIYAQRYTAQGHPLGKNFGVNDDEGDVKQETPSVSTDGKGNLVITWEDWRNQFPDIYAQRYTPQGQPWGKNFRVNDVPGYAEQGSPSVFTDAGGNFIITWADNRYGDADIFVQCFAADITPRGKNFRVNDDLGNAAQGSPSLSADPAGNFMITWQDRRNGDFDNDIYAQRYAADGQLLDGNFQINNDQKFAYQNHPSLSVDHNGNFMIAWEDNRLGYYDIYAQLCTAGGGLKGLNFKVTDDSGSVLGHSPSVSAAGNGDFVITWVDEREDNKYTDVFAQRYNAEGIAEGHNFKVNDDAGGTFQTFPSISIDGSGNFVIVWQDGRNIITEDIYAQRYSREGIVMGMNFKVNDDSAAASQSRPSVSMSGNGKFIVTWQDKRNEKPEIYAQLYNEDGTVRGLNFKVSDDQGNASNWSPSLSVNENGSFVIAWERWYQGEFDIYARRYSADGNPLGSGFRVNNDPGHIAAGSPSVSTDGNGNFVIVWENVGSEGNDIYAQRYTGQGKALGKIFRITGTGIKNQYDPVVKLWKGRIYSAWTDYPNLDVDSDIWANVLDWNDPVSPPSDHNVSLNYPNPFNALTHIEFDVRETNRVTLKIYDIQGRLVSTLIDANMAPGNYTVDFSGNNRASGIYFYRIKIGPFTTTGKMILSR